MLSLRFLMYGVLAAPFAEFFEFDFALNLFLIFAAPIADSFTALTLELYEVILGHRGILKN